MTKPNVNPETKKSKRFILWVLGTISVLVITIAGDLYIRPLIAPDSDYNFSATSEQLGEAKFIIENIGRVNSDDVNIIVIVKWGIYTSHIDIVSIEHAGGAIDAKCEKLKVYKTSHLDPDEEYNAITASLFKKASVASIYCSRFKVGDRWKGRVTFNEPKSEKRIYDRTATGLVAIIDDATNRVTKYASFSDIGM